MLKHQLRNLASTTLRAFVRPVTPRIISEYNGVKVGSHRFLDCLLPAEKPFDDEYKKNLVEAVQEAVDSGDKVVIVGGGFGVTSVHAAFQSRHFYDSPSEKVVTYECSKERVQNCRDCFSLNGVDVDLREAAVGVVKKKVGNVSEADFVHPSDLPDCDVLELDCEGAEVEILQEMDIRPGTVVVETHAEFDASTEKVKNVLSDLGYEIVEERPDAPYTDDNVLAAKYRGELR